MRFRTVVSAAFCAALLSGCEPSNLYIAHDTVVGVNGAMNADQTSGHLIVGYDRKFAAIVPKSVTRPDDGSGVVQRDAMSVLSCSELKVDGIFLTGFTEYLATGPAAVKFARKLAGKAADPAEQKKTTTGETAPTTESAPGEPGAATPQEKAQAKMAMDKIFDCYTDPAPVH
jgi:hypothetical protein